MSPAASSHGQPALGALFDDCNSLHTNAYDEAITAPTEQSVRRAVAIQMIVDKELGLNFNENSWQGSFMVDQLTDLVEEAVYKEFGAIGERDDVFSAMETLYQRGKIQDESMYYEHKKHDGSLPLVSVKTHLGKDHGGEITTTIELIRSTEDEKGKRITNVRSYRQRQNATDVPPSTLVGKGTGRGGNVPQAWSTSTPPRKRENLFVALIGAVKTPQPWTNQPSAV